LLLVSLTAGFDQGQAWRCRSRWTKELIFQAFESWHPEFVRDNARVMAGDDEKHLS